MLRTKGPAVVSSNFMKIRGAMMHEKKTIDPKRVAADNKPVTKRNSDIMLVLRYPSCFRSFRGFVRQ